MRSTGKFIPYREDLAERQQFDSMNQLFNGQSLVQIASNLDTWGRSKLNSDGSSGSFSQQCFIMANECHAAAEKIIKLEEENDSLKQLAQFLAGSIAPFPEDLRRRVEELTAGISIDLNEPIDGEVSFGEEDEDEDDDSAERRIDNALEAASGTCRTPGVRIIKIMSALGFDFGDSEDIDASYAKFYKEQEQYRKLTVQKLFVVFGGELVDLSGAPTFRDPNNIHVAGIFDNEKTARDVWKGNAQRTVDNALMRYFVVPLADALNAVAMAEIDRK